jgi:hypothetical protein
MSSRRKQNTDRIIPEFWSEASGIDSNLIAGKNRILDQSISERNWGYLGSGGIYTNAGDLYKWFKALADSRIIGRGSLNNVDASIKPE